MANRGQLTKAIKTRSMELLHWPVDVVELRLMAYVQYKMVNEQCIERRHVNDTERKVLDKWRKLDLIKMDNTIGSIRITKKFWDIICELIYMAYVDID